MIRLGYKASNEQFPPRELLDYAVLAEQSGFDSVFVSDHLQPWRQDGGWITTSGKDPALYTDTLLPAIAEGAAAADRSTDDIEKMIEVKVSFDHDRDEAMRATHFWGALGLTAEQKSGVEDPVEMQRLADELSVEQTAKRFIVSTDPDEHVEKIKRYLDLGFNHLVFHAPGPDQP